MFPVDPQMEAQSLNYIILAHKNPAQVARLIRALRTDATRFYVHVDRNVAIAPFQRLLAAEEDCCFVEPREKGTWGDLGIVHATLHALRQVVADRRTGHCVLLSGQDYPIKSNDYIAQHFAQNPDTSFVRATLLPDSMWDHDGRDRLEYYKFNWSDEREDYTQLPPLLTMDFMRHCSRHVATLVRLLRRGMAPWAVLKKRRFPPYLRPCGGDQWWAVPVATAANLLKFLHDHPDYLRYHRYTLLPDEIALQSVFRHLAESQDPTQLRPPVTYVNWERPGAVVLPVTFDRHDFHEVTQQPAGFLFARKFDMDADAHILDLLDRFRAKSSA
jgi:hypothetical protein